MNSEKAISDLVEISQYAAKHPQFVQGGGGNCSVKYLDMMVIKASGVFLEDVSNKKGFVTLNIQGIKVPPEQKPHPSLETSIHLLLGKYVIHTHPIVIGAIVCAKEGKIIFKDLFKNDDCFWINYTSPGEQLSKKIKGIIGDFDLNHNLVLLLENHGIFISTSSKEACINLHETIIKNLETYFNYDQFNFITESVSVNGYLTPDHIVYSTLNKQNASIKELKAINEQDLYAKQVIALINSKKSGIKYLTNEEVNFIQTMKEEKYRQKLLKE